MTLHGSSEGADAGEGSGEPREPRHPVDTLRIAMIVYIAVNLLYGIPLTFVPGSFLDVIGVEEATAGELGGLRWMGAMLLAWGVSGILVLARPVGRAYFVTAGALQLTFGAAAVLFPRQVIHRAQGRHVVPEVGPARTPAPCRGATRCGG